MTKINLFNQKPDTFPQIYVYSDVRYIGQLKIGYTIKKDVKDRIKEQYPLVLPDGKRSYNLLWYQPSVRDNGTFFNDKDVHRYLKSKGIENTAGEWFRCSLKDVKIAIIAVKKGIKNQENRTETFKMRPEQEEAVNRTSKFFKDSMKSNTNRPSHYLWNAKMRFGKTFATYQLAIKMGWTKILILTFKPAVESAWKEDLGSHVDFEGWQFIANDALRYEEIDKKRPFACFGSFQDYLGKNSAGGIKLKNKWVHATLWDCVVFDEYHYGAWREAAKELFESESKKEIETELGGQEYFNEEYMPIRTTNYLYLSGTPFRAISSGEFIEEQIFNWTYSDEQRAKENYAGENNPYASLPRMILMTYKMPDYIRDIALKGEFNEFDLNTFFNAKGNKDDAKFTYENEVQKWLDLIRGASRELGINNLKLGAKKPPLPFEDVRLLKILSHTVWFLPDVASCYAMKNLLLQKQNTFYNDYKIIVVAGKSAGIGIKAIEPVKKAMKNPIETKTIALTCGKLTTGVTIAPWVAIFMLRNLKTPETYFQAAFRVQSSWTIDGENGKVIMKDNCYVFDFAPDRALSQIAQYSCSLNISEISPEIKVKEFINFLPVLAYDGVVMEEIDAAGLLDIAMSGTTSTLLARRWECALLVNVDNETLKRLINNEEAMKAIMNIEGFRQLNQDIDIIINKCESIKKIKKLANDGDLTKVQTKKLTEDEKIYRDKRKKIQEKLVKFATRIPLFMYLTDYREAILKDVITLLEPKLFRKVTGLAVKDFELLLSLGLFNSQLMNQAVYNFRRYEDASISYSGINKHAGENIGLFDITATEKEFKSGNS